MSIVQRLVRDAESLGVTLSEPDAVRLVRLLDELERWNRTYNLTAIRQREDMLTHHLLDSLSIHTDLEGTTVADVGTGAGFPGLPLAVVNPDRNFTLIDSNGKKIRFVEHAAHELGLRNVAGIQSRAASIQPAMAFDTVVSRAFAPLQEMLVNVAGMCGPQTRVLAMKGKWPQAEIDSLPPGWRQQGSRELTVPGLEGARCVIALRRDLSGRPK